MAAVGIPPLRVVYIKREGEGKRDGYYPQIKNVKGVGWLNLESNSLGCPDMRTVNRRFKNELSRMGCGVIDPLILDAPIIEITHKDWECAGLEGAYKGKRALWIGGGASSAKLVGMPAGWYDEKYDVVACANYGWEAFAPAAKKCKSAQWFWFNVEATGKDLWADKARWLRDIPECFTRILLCHESTISSLNTAGTEGDITNPVDYVLVKKACNQPFDARSYGRGLQCGAGEEGTVSLQALHFFGILGCDSIDIYGTELGFTKTDPVHFYEAEYKEQPTWQEAQWDAAAHYIHELLPEFENAGIKLNWRCRSKVIE